MAWWWRTIHILITKGFQVFTSKTTSTRSYRNTIFTPSRYWEEKNEYIKQYEPCSEYRSGVIRLNPSGDLSCTSIFHSGFSDWLWLQTSKCLETLKIKPDLLSGSNNRNLVLTLVCVWRLGLVSLCCSVTRWRGSTEREEIHRAGGLLRQSVTPPQTLRVASWSCEETKPQRWLASDQSDCGVPPPSLPVCCVIIALSNQPRLAPRGIYPPFLHCSFSSPHIREVGLRDELTGCNVGRSAG